MRKCIRRFLIVILLLLNCLVGFRYGYRYYLNHDTTTNRYTQYYDKESIIARLYISRDVNDDMEAVTEGMTAEEIVAYSNTLLPDSILNAMKDHNLQVYYVNEDELQDKSKWVSGDDLGYIAYYNPNKVTITLRREEISVTTYLHEVGHFVDDMMGWPSEGFFWHDCLKYKEYCSSPAAGYNSEYFTQSGEFFAEMFAYYFVDRGNEYLQIYCPGIVGYMDYLLEDFEKHDNHTLHLHWLFF